MPESTQITALLTNRELDRLGRLRLKVSRRFTNRGRGEHLGVKGGTSTEFCDYRDYAAGDDVRFVDWNIFARIQRPYLKQFHQEEELHVAVLIDASRSMLFEEKFALAQRLGAALGVLGLRGGEKVSAYAFGTTGPAQRLKPSRGRSAQGKLFAFLENIEGGGETPVERGVESFLRHHSGRGVAVILSDFLSDGNIRRAFNLLHNGGLETFAVQLLGPSELAPEIAGDLRFVDSETDAHLDISGAGDLLSLYHEYRAANEAQLSALCQQRSGKFLSISSAEPFERVVFDLMRRRGWIV